MRTFSKFVQFSFCTVLRLCSMSVATVGTAEVGSTEEVQPRRGDSSAGYGDVPTRSVSKRDIALDAVSIGINGASWGFGIAKWATDAGFNIASTAVKGSAGLIEKAAGENAISSGLHGVNGVVAAAHTSTRFFQDVAETITHASLTATKAGLEASGGKSGGLLRMTIGEDYAEAVMAVEAMVRRFSGPMSGVPMAKLLPAVNAWSAMQQAAAMTQMHAIEQVALPEHSERWMRFSAAALGSFAAAADISVAALARSNAAKAAGKAPAEVALAWAGIDGNVEVLAFEQSSKDLYAPGYMVAVDYDLGHVVVAFRGTSSVADVLSDLDCNAVPVSLGGLEGKAHSGMWKAAQRLDEPIAAVVKVGLGKLRASGRQWQNPLQLMVTGHSLGAGTASLLTALWRDRGRFAGVNVRCMAFACPQVLDLQLAITTSNYTTSIVLGNDVVPRFSLATSHDLRDVLLHLSSPQDFGLDSSFHAEEVLAAASRGDANHLTEKYFRVKTLACTSSDRLFPSGHLMHIDSGHTTHHVGPQAFDEILISRDMAYIHMPGCYITALQQAPSAPTAASGSSDDAMLVD
eukprot:TRINITY_DN27334_c0_g1_i1.p1 TRINITY_DN27334_c0_g1~~TRINITY_DN27334_c0_g1_i1.p1  ORF type:complete len:574 (+),score=114.17 TRINITY_DN27334_c0_g1_i1:40-1761(+)